MEGKSPNTVHAYEETLRRFLRIAGEEGFPADVARITPVHLYAYLGSFTHLALESRHRFFREVRCFFNWLVQAGLSRESPSARCATSASRNESSNRSRQDDIGRLLARCDSSTSIGARDQAILFTLLDTGIRCSELVQLSLEDLDLTTGRLRILHGKGNKQRVAPFASRCRQALQHYLQFRGSNPGPLFCAASGSHDFRRRVALKPNGLKQMLRRLGRDTGLAKVHAHRFRHTFATWAIEQDARELDVQFLLGHSSPDMVRRYASTYNVEQAARRHGAFSPADRLELPSIA